MRGIKSSGRILIQRLAEFFWTYSVASRGLFLSRRDVSKVEERLDMLDRKEDEDYEVLAEIVLSVSNAVLNKTVRLVNEAMDTLARIYQKRA